jgi:hypothetical protein
MVVPTLHVLFVREDRLNILEAPKNSIQQPVREELLDWIANEALGGDRDAAEWVLLTCVARVYAFQDFPGRRPSFITLSPLVNHARVHSTHRP